MANLDFFAVRVDHKAIIDFLFHETDVRLFESYSRFESDIREFHNFDELDDAFEVGADSYGNGAAILLQLWSPSIMQRLQITRISLNPASCSGHTFRYTIEGGALIQLYLGGECNRVITRSHFGHNSRRRAEIWGIADGIDWAALAKISNKIQYHIRRRLAAIVIRGNPVLSSAYSLAKSGHELKETARTPWSYELPSIEKSE